MNKISTADCRNFLVQQVSLNPKIINDIWNDDLEGPKALVIARKAGNWKRTCKFDPNGTHDLVQPNYDLWALQYGPSTGSIPAQDLSVVREFCLSPDMFEDAIKFQVLETKQGQLVLGAYVGD